MAFLPAVTYQATILLFLLSVLYALLKNINDMRRTLFLFALVVGTLAVLHLFSNKNTERKAYVQWLEEQYALIPEMDYEEAKAIPKLDRPDLAAMQNFLTVVDPKEKRVPRERLLAAYNTTKAREKHRDNGYLDSLTWEIQPSVMGGRTRALMWDPNSSSGNRVWAGSVTGGLWYNNNIANEEEPWQSVDAFWANLSISCITYDPNNTMVFYVGTGEAETAIQTYRSSSGLGYGILKSNDGGETWDFLESTQEWAYVTDIQIRSENGVSVIYAAVASGEYNGPHQSAPSDGLYRSEDGGVSWEQVLPNMTGSDTPYTPADITMTANGRLIVGTMPNINGEGGATILYSDQGTEGTWSVNETYKTLIEGGTSGYYLPGRIMLAAAPSDTNRVYGIVAGGYLDTYPYYHCRYVIKSTNGGESWVNVSNPSGGQWSSLAWHAFTVEVDPNDADKLYIGGLDEWTSSNAGNTWIQVSEWALMYYGGGDDYVHADQHIIAYKPGSSSEAIFGTDGGVFYTDNAHSSNPVFQQRNNHYNTLQFYSCAIKPVAGSPELLGGLQDNGSLWHNGAPVSIFDMVQGGDGAFCFFDENEPNYAYTSVYYNRYNTYVNGQAYNYLGEETGTFVNAGDLDWKDNILFNNGVKYTGANAHKIHRYANVPLIGSSSYFTVPTGDVAYFSAITYSRHSDEGDPVIFVGTNAGKLFRVNNADAPNPQSSEITGTNFPIGNISSIAVGGSADTLLVTFSNYGVPSVWQTYDGGQTWNNIESDLPDMPIRWALYHPENSLQVMLATETGIWTTVNAAAEEVTWTPNTLGLGNVRVDMIRVRTADNKVVAATHGRGLHVADWPVDLSVKIQETETESLSLYPNPATDKVTIVLPDYQNSQLIIHQGNGAVALQKQITQPKETINTTSLKEGFYTVSVVKENKTTHQTKLLIAR
ncbi:MAG: hypothetical protein CSA95_00700 [Bacteroidetes bacterium]|nr:MAG: hypothetical protein CSA95_00700 [Bacteroidota bacterium]PIE88435.1 MAG: hypothetical protein CSA04_01915 [Bacteroidota bacterium]